MKAINKTAQRILEKLVTGLAVGEERTVDAGGGFMAVHVIRRTATLYSVAHYYQQNGDMMADPEVDFWLGPDGCYYPAQFRQDSIGLRQEAIEFSADGNVTGFRPRQQADIASFCGTWMRNIRAQQAL